MPDDVVSSEDLEAVIALVKRMFPAANLYQVDNQWQLVTIHGVGTTEEAAMKAALKDFREMSEDGKSLPQILDDIRADLAERGMSRTRHDSLHELLNIAEKALDDGILTNTVPWIMRAGYSRQIEELKQRVTTRLNMVAQEMQANEKARHNAARKFPELAAQRAELAGLSPYQRLRFKPIP